MSEKENESLGAKLFKELCEPFINLFKAPRALWGINIAYFLEGLAYFGILGYLAMFINEHIGLNDEQAGYVVGVLTSGITLTMFFFGSISDKIGVRKTLIISLSLLALGRIIMALSGFEGAIFGSAALGLWNGAHITALVGIIIVVLGYGMFMPSCYAAVKEFTSEKDSAMGYAMLYALSNLGGWLPTFFPPLRKAIGLNGVIALLAGVTLLTLILTVIILSKKTVEEAKTLAKKLREEEALAKKAKEAESTEKKEEEKEVIPTCNPDDPWNKKLLFWLKNHPLADWRFSFFIFALIPVQTLFAHNWLTLPQYVSRAFSNTWIGDNFEAAVNFNPLLIFILVPVIAALTKKANVYLVMVIGTAVMASPTFILALGPTVPNLVLFLVLMTIGEALWQPRFLQLAADLAPAGRTGAYMGVAQLPWFLTKCLVPLYSGWFLKQYCPQEGELHTETMWLIYGFIAISSTILLILAKPMLSKKLAKK